MEILRCPNGHFYDPSQTSSCPKCAQNSSMGGGSRREPDTKTDEKTEETPTTPAAPAEWVNPFTDVKADVWYADAVKWGEKTGVVNGMTKTTFEPEGKVTRAQFVTMLYRYAERCGYDVTALSELAAFEDAASVAEYAEAPMRWAVANAIVGGDNGKLLPRGSATRAQCAKMISVFYDTFVAAGE